jgi:hypothetical protein
MEWLPAVELYVPRLMASKSATITDTILVRHWGATITLTHEHEVYGCSRLLFT